ncbi:MAG: cytochrome c biogenesis protein CcsA [Bdellovibrionota bacterium]
MLHEWSVNSLNASAFIYLASMFVLFIGAIRNIQTSKWVCVGKALAALAFSAHTFGLLSRWYIGGIERPPWTNLYESLIFFAWGAAVFLMLALFKWRVTLVGVFLTPFIFLLMGMSVMTPNKLVEPLIPALQSYWNRIHVVFGMLSYGAIMSGASLAFLQLIKNKYSIKKIGAMLSLLSVMMVLMIAGKEFYKSGRFEMARTVEQVLPDGSTVHTKDIYRDYEGGPVITRTEEVPAGSIPVFFSLACFLSAALVYLSKRKEKDGHKLFGLGIFSLFVLVAWIFWAIRHNEHLTLQSNPYLLMAIITTFFFDLFLVLAVWKKTSFMDSLPSAERLDELSYKNLLFAFPAQMLLLITGAIWAYYSWGRSWGWDPKETWAFITWVGMLIYLHGKLLMKWKANLLSVVFIGILALMIFAFLGVNLLLSGLHSYGSA